MRETSLARNERGEEAGKIRVLTGDRGTEVLDAGGRVLREFGTDRHAEQIALHEAEGWRVTQHRHRRPSAMPQSQAVAHPQRKDD